MTTSAFVRRAAQRAQDPRTLLEPVGSPEIAGRGWIREDQTPISESHILDLDDGSRWQIFPGYLDLTQLEAETNLAVVPSEDEISSHMLMNGGSKVHEIAAGDSWPIKKAKSILKEAKMTSQHAPCRRTSWKRWIASAAPRDSPNCRLPFRCQLRAETAALLRAVLDEVCENASRCDIRRPRACVPYLRRPGSCSTEPRSTQGRRLSFRPRASSTIGTLDLPVPVRGLIASKLEKSGVPPPQTAKIKGFVPIGRSDRASL